MIGTLFQIVFSKIGGLVVAVVGFLALWLGYKRQKVLRSQAETERDGLQVQVDHQQVTQAIDKRTEQIKDTIDAMPVEGGPDDDQEEITSDLLDILRSGKWVRPGGPGNPEGNP